MERLLNNLVTLDRRIIYLVVAVVLIVSLVVSLVTGKKETATVQPSVQQLYDAIAQAPDNKLIILDATFSPNTLPENGNQFRALVRHAVLAKKRFAIMALDQQGAGLGIQIVQDVTKQYGYTYGKDWISFGFQLGALAFFKQVIKDVPKAMSADGVNGEPLTPENFPIMRGIRTIKDISIIVEVTASAAIWSWIQIVEPAAGKNLQLGYACTGVMSAEAYPLLDAGQIIGLMPGLKGAADYEQLVDDLEAGQPGRTPYEPDTLQELITKPARVLMFTQNYAHIAVLLLILIGNLALLVRYMLGRNTKKAANP
jgi:hypothetical protein